MRVKQTWRIIALSLLCTLGLPSIAFAAQSSSTNYQVNEVFVGSGGELNACSTTYCSKQSAGDLAVGNAASANYQAQAGFNTDRTPYIECVVSNTSVDLGSLSASSTKTATATFTVKAYLAHGYSVRNASDPPTNNSYTLTPISIPSGSVTGTEQFGMNLVANTTPITFGADPVQHPDNSFAFGVVSADYSATNTYKYTKGDVIASSPSSSSTTTYTISYIFNMSNVTPGGAYNFNHVLVATGTY